MFFHIAVKSHPNFESYEKNITWKYFYALLQALGHFLVSIFVVVMLFLSVFYCSIYCIILFAPLWLSLPARIHAPIKEVIWSAMDPYITNPSRKRALINYSLHCPVLGNSVSTLAKSCSECDRVLKLKTLKIHFSGRLVRERIFGHIQGKPLKRQCQHCKVYFSNKLSALIIKCIIHHI